MFLQSRGSYLIFTQNAFALDSFQGKYKEVIRAFGNMMDAGTLQELGLFSLKKKSPREDMITVFNNTCRKDKRNELFFTSSESRTRSNTLNL